MGMRPIYRGVVTFYCKSKEEVEALFRELDKILNAMPNLFHAFQSEEIYVTEKDEVGE